MSDSTAVPRRFGPRATARLGGRVRRLGVATAVAIVGGSAFTVAPAGAFPGQTIRITATSTLDGSESQKTVTATCPDGRTLAGAGANINNGGGNVVLDEIRPNGSDSTTPTAVTARAFESQGGTNANWTLTAYAICTNLPFQFHRRYYSESAPFSSSSSVTETVSCYGSMSLLGSGFDIVGGGGQVKLYKLSPDLATNTVTVRASEDEDGYGGNWTLRAYAVCGYLEGAVYELKSGFSGTNKDSKDATVSCDPGSTLLSSGLTLWSQSEWNNDGPDDRLTVDEIRPSGSTTTTPKSATVWVLVDPDWDGPWWEDWFWEFHAHAVCVDPA